MVNSAGLWSCGVSVVLATDYRHRTSAVAETMQASPPVTHGKGRLRRIKTTDFFVVAEFDLYVEN